MIEAFPLQWPAGYPRTTETSYRKSSTFKVTADKARKELLEEIKRLSGDDSPIISSNVPLRKDGGMYADIAADDLKEPGVAIYFQYEGNPISIACDKWLTPAENIRALSLTINSLRGLDRWGCSQMLQRVFTGFKALPHSTESEKEIFEMLGLKSKPALVTAVTQAYHDLAKKLHPDVPGGNADKFALLQSAYQQALNFYK